MLGGHQQALRGIIRHQIRQVRQDLLGALATPSDRFTHAQHVQIRAVIEQGIDHGQAQSPPEIAGEIVKAGRIFQTIGRQGAQRQIIDRHHAHHHAKPTQDLRDQQFIKIPILGDIDRKPCPQRKARKAPADQPARGRPRRQAPDNGGRDEHGNARDKHGLADHQGGIAAHTREINRIKISEPVKTDAHDNRHQTARPEIAVVKGRQIDNRLLGFQTAPEKNCRADHRGDGAPCHQLAVEPVFAGSLFQHIFERAQKDRHRQQARPIEIIKQRGVRLVKIDQGPCHGRDHNAGHQIDQKQPMP